MCEQSSYGCIPSAENCQHSVVADQVQNKISCFDKSSWYELEHHLLSPILHSTFVLSFLDADTERFIDVSTETSNSFFLQLYYALMSLILSFFLPKTSINGMLKRGGMFLFSSAQFRELLKIPPEWNASEKQVLDLGAGDGGITEVMSIFYNNVYVTEMSQTMQWRLRSKGFHIEDVERWSLSSRRYDLVSALNLLDRHYNPRQLLRNIHAVASRSSCLILLAVVLPMHQYVEFHPSRGSTKADITLMIKGRTTEEQASFLVDKEFLPIGLEVLRWTKLPYLCEGDFSKPYYVLEDVVFLLRPVPAKKDVSTLVDDLVHVEL